MKILLQLGIIFSVCIAGEAVSLLLPFPFPGSVLSMLILFVLLLLQAPKTEQIRETADFFQKNMAFFFIPSSVDIMQNFPILKEIWLPFLLICVVSTFVAFGVTAWTVTGVIALQNIFTRKNGPANGKNGGDAV